MTVNITNKTVVAYVDGASANNQHKDIRCGGWGAILMLVNDNGVRDSRPEAYKELSGQLPSVTNNQAELEAVRQVLLSLKRDGVLLTIVTDSAYIIGVLSQHWKPTKNKDLIVEVKALLEKHTVTFQKVTGHSGVEHNDRADALAVAATKA